MQSTASINAAISALSAVGHRSYSATELRHAGIDRHALHRRIRAGQAHRVLPRVYADGPPGTPLLPATRRAVAVRAGGKGAALIRQTAARHHGIWNRGARIIHAGSERTRPPAPLPWLRLHRCRLPDDEVVVIDGIPCTTVVRTILDLGWELTPWQVAAVIREAVRRRKLVVAELEQALLGRRTRAARVVREALALRAAGSAGTRSTPEDQVLDGIRRHRSLPIPLVNVRGATGLVGVELDFVWPRERVVLEVDGSGHEEPGLATDDEEKDRELRSRGWIVIRVTPERVHQDLGSVIAAIERAVRCPPQ